MTTGTTGTRRGRRKPGIGRGRLGIAKRCAVSHEFVRQLRASLSTVDSEPSLAGEASEPSLSTVDSEPSLVSKTSEPTQPATAYRAPPAAGDSVGRCGGLPGISAPRRVCFYASPAARIDDQEPARPGTPPRRVRGSCRRSARAAWAGPQAKQGPWQARGGVRTARPRNRTLPSSPRGRLYGPARPRPPNACCRGDGRAVILPGLPAKGGCEWVQRDRPGPASPGCRSRNGPTVRGKREQGS